MNIIFLDMDGVMDTTYYFKRDKIEEKFKILGEICNDLDCKVVIEASCKSGIDEYTLEYESDWISFIFDMFKKYNIECIGRTPEVGRFNNGSGVSMWKEDEILLYLSFHPEVEHFCVIDDDDYYEYTGHRISDLEKLRDYLVKTIYTDLNNPLNEGLLLKHKEDIAIILKKENIFKNYIKEHKEELTKDFKNSFFSKIERELCENIEDDDDIEKVRSELNKVYQELEEYYKLIENGFIDQVYDKVFIRKKGK